MHLQLELEADMHLEYLNHLEGDMHLHLEMALHLENPAFAQTDADWCMITGTFKDKGGDEEGEGHGCLFQGLEGVQDSEHHELDESEQMKTLVLDSGHIWKAWVCARSEVSPQKHAVKELVPSHRRDAHEEEDSEERSLGNKFQN